MFSLVCVCSTFRRVPHPRSVGWGVPIPCLGGDTWSQVWVGVPHPRSGWGGTPSQVWMVGGIPSQVWMGGYPGVPPGLIWMVGGTCGTPTTTGWGIPLTMTGWGNPSSMTGWGTPLHQHSKHLLHSGQYATCVHAGELSCSL